MRAGFASLDDARWQSVHFNTGSIGVERPGIEMPQPLTTSQRPPNQADHATPAVPQASAQTAEANLQTPSRSSSRASATLSADVEEAELLAQRSAQTAHAVPQPPTTALPRRRTRWPD